MLSLVMVGGTENHDKLDIVELIDVNLDCTIQPIPMRASGLSSVNGMVCGGAVTIGSKTIYNSKCWQLNPNGTWSTVKPMSEGKNQFTLNMVGKEIFAIGGYDAYGISFTVEKFSGGSLGNWTKLTKAPFAIRKHCTVLIDNFTLFVIGGENLKVR